jgi:uncharacterized membrane protein (DUF485 family)
LCRPSFITNEDGPSTFAVIGSAKSNEKRHHFQGETAAMDKPHLSARAVSFSAIIIVIYVLLLTLSVFAKPLVGTVLFPGLSVGILLTVAAILLSIALTWQFVRSANSREP